MKRILEILLVVLVALSTILYGCGKKARDPNLVIDALKDLDSYTCNIKMEVKNDKQILEYDIKEYYQKDYGYRLEIGKDRVYIYKDNKIYVKDLKGGSSFIEDKAFDSVFHLSIIEEYIDLLYTDEDIKYSYKVISGEEFVTIELTIPGESKNINTGTMYINTKNNIPEFLYIYDITGKERIKITYSNFNPEVLLSKDIFSLT